jgi:hypothetical protein
MKLFLPLWISILACPWNVNAQIHPILAHAIELAKIESTWDETQNKLILSVQTDSGKIAAYSLLNLYPTSQSQSFFSQWNNTFFELGSDEAEQSYFNLHSLRSKEESEIAELFPTFPLQNIAIGLTDFLILRAGKELQLAFFQKLQRELTHEKYQELGLLFPETKNKLELLASEMQHYNLFLSHLKTCFENDLKQLPYRLLNLIPQHLNTETAKAEFILLRAGLLAGLKHPNGFSIGQLILSLAQEMNPHLTANPSSKELSSLINTLSLLAIFSESFRNPNDSNSNDYWLNAKAINTLVRSPKVLFLYLGLLELNLSNSGMPGKSAEILKGQLKSLANKNGASPSFLSFIQTMGRFIEWSKRESYLQEKTNSASYTSTLQMLIEQTQQLSQLFPKSFSFKPGDSIPDQNTLIALVNPMASAISIVKATQNRDYMRVVTDAVSILNRIIPESNKHKSKITKDVLHYGAFMAKIAMADSAESVTEIINAFAVPPGSYSVKRNSAFTISLNGFLGGAGGIETINVNNQKNSKGNWALTAPVGLSFDLGLGKPKCRHSLGLFFPIIDLGVMASYRLENPNSDVSSLPDIQWNQIFAPGLFLEYGMGRSPISLGVGYQTGPQLREALTENISLSEQYHRFALTLKIDIPIFYLYTRSR